MKNKKPGYRTTLRTDLPAMAHHQWIEIHTERDLWRFKALVAMAANCVLAFLILCFGIGQFFYGG